MRRWLCSTFCVLHAAALPACGNGLVDAAATVTFSTDLGSDPNTQDVPGPTPAPVRSTAFPTVYVRYQNDVNNCLAVQEASIDQSRRINVTTCGPAPEQQWTIEGGMVKSQGRC